MCGSRTLCFPTRNCQKDLIYSSIRSLNDLLQNYMEPKTQKTHTYTKHTVCALWKQLAQDSGGTDVGETQNMPIWVIDFSFFPLLWSRLLLAKGNTIPGWKDGNAFA